MRVLVAVVAFLGLLLIGSPATVEASIFFEEQFSGPMLDPSVWRTEILTSGVRWCDAHTGAWWDDGTWVEEGSNCFGVAAQSPYGAAILSDGLLHLSSSNGQACPYLDSRLPGSVALFPPSGDFTLKVRMRYDLRTPWGVGLVVFQSESTEPSGSNRPVQLENVLVSVWASPGLSVNTAFGGTPGGELVTVAWVSSPDEFHEYTLDCVGNSFTISVDDQVVYGPVTSALRPTAAWMGNPVLAYWYPTLWGSFSIDHIRVEVPETTPVKLGTWGALKAGYRG